MLDVLLEVSAEKRRAGDGMLSPSVGSVFLHRAHTVSSATRTHFILDSSVAPSERYCLLTLLPPSGSNTLTTIDIERLPAVTTPSSASQNSASTCCLMLTESLQCEL